MSLGSWVATLVSLSMTTGAFALSEEAKQKLDGLRFKFEASNEQLEKPLADLLAQYKAKAAELASSYQQAGDLAKTIAARDASQPDAPEPSAASIAGQPQELARLGRVYIDSKAARARERDDRRIELQRAFLGQLGVLRKQLAEAGDAVSADDIKLEAERVAGEIARGERSKSIGERDFEIQGKFHSYIDDTCSFYINGKKVFWHGHYGGSWSPKVTLKVGDCVVFSVHDYGNERRFRTAFISTSDGEVDEHPYVVSFRAADMREIPDENKNRVFTREQYEAMAAKPYAVESSWDAGTPVPNRSDWIWGEGSNVAMVTFITPEMIEVGIPKEEK